MEEFLKRPQRISAGGGIPAYKEKLPVMANYEISSTSSMIVI
jgi:hypothetical protein